MKYKTHSALLRLYVNRFVGLKPGFPTAEDQSHCRPVKTGNAPQNGGFPTSRRPDQRHDFSGLAKQADIERNWLGLVQPDVKVR